jgi:hypothetical protein
MRGWSWCFVPHRRLLDSEIFLGLSAAQRGVLLTCYMVCDQHGRFAAGSRAFLRTGLAPEDRAHLVELHRVGLVTLYDVGGVVYGELERYAKDAPSAVGKLKDDRYPEPGTGTIRPRSGPHPDFVMTPSGFHPAPVAISSGHQPPVADAVPSTDFGDLRNLPGFNYSLDDPDPIVTPSGSHQDPVTLPSGTEEKRREERRGSTKVLPKARAYDTQESVSSEPASETPRQPGDQQQALIGPETSEGSADVRELDERGTDFIDEYNRRVNGHNWGAGNHSGGFFAEDGALELEDWLNRLRVQQPKAYTKALGGFWSYWDARSPGEPPRKPKKVIESWLIKEGALKSVAQQVMEVVR